MMNFLKSFLVKVELFAGTDIDVACRELCEFATRLGIRVEAEFNGMKLWARPGDEPHLLAADWHRQLKTPSTPSTYKIAQAKVVDA